MPFLNEIDVPAIERRFEAWWHGQIVDRPPVTVKVASSAEPFRKHPGSTRDRWMDAEYAIERAEHAFAQGPWVGEQLPILMPSLGPDICGTLFGSELEFSETTSWSHPVLESCRQVLDRRPNFENPYWRAIRRLTELSIERGRGRWITGVTDLHTNVDLLSCLRGPESLCMELMDDRAGVRLACDHVTRFFPGIFDDQCRAIAAAGQPCTSWIPFLHRGRAYNVQSDFICMISPEDFRAVVQPALAAEMAHLDRSVYHLDGPGALAHLDALLEMPQLHAIQWMFGTGQGPASRWIDVFRRIQRAGKSIVLECENIEDARRTAEHLRPEGVWFRIWGAYPLEEARAFVEWASRWAGGSS